MANKHKNKRSFVDRGWTWVGYFPRITKTKKAKIKSIENKHKGKGYDND